MYDTGSDEDDDQLSTSSHENIKKAKTEYFKQMEKTDKTLKELLGATDMVTPKKTGVGFKKRSFLFKCEHCKKKFLGHAYATHLQRKHKYSYTNSKLQQSKLRVLYLWISNKKTGVQRPLPCPICNIWHIRLDAHLTRKHSDIEEVEAKEILLKEREKNWGDFELNDDDNDTNVEHVPNTSDSRFQVRNKQPDISNTQNLLNYVPPNAKTLTKKLREMWGIGNEDYFDFYYEDADCLLDAFKEHLIEIGIEESGASQHRQHVNYVWQVLDKDRVVLPCTIFTY